MIEVVTIGIQKSIVVETAKTMNMSLLEETAVVAVEIKTTTILVVVAKVKMVNAMAIDKEGDVTSMVVEKDR